VANEATLKARSRNCLLVVILHLWLNSIISSSSCSTSSPDHCLSFCPGVGTSSALVVCALGLLHGNWHGLALPNCYLKAFHSLLIQVLKERNALENFVRGFAFGTATSRPSIAYLFRCRKDGMLGILLFVGLHSRTATWLVCMDLCFDTCKKHYRPLPKFGFLISQFGPSHYRHSEINDSLTTSLTRPLTNNVAKSEISTTVLHFASVAIWGKGAYELSASLSLFCAYLVWAAPRSAPRLHIHIYIYIHHSARLASLSSALTLKGLYVGPCASSRRSNTPMVG